jgi:hypothetical protein
VRELQQANQEVRARLAELEKPRGLRAWFGKPRPRQPEE